LGVRELPHGTVTFLFTDIEGSTRLLHELGENYAEALAEHRRVLRESFARHGGVEVDTQGDGFFAVFERASEAVACAAEAQRALEDGPLRVRMGLHTGEPALTAEGYVGADVPRAARIMSAAHGGQVLVSDVTRRLADSRTEFRDLGERRLKDLPAPERLFQLGEAEFPPLRSLNNTNLPLQLDAFVGRERDLEDLLHVMRSSEARLVTLTGPGGVGKTRLALELAGKLVNEFDDGVWFIELAGVGEPDLVLPTVLATLGLKTASDHHVAARNLLLVLDNFEHVVDAAPDVHELVTRSTDMRVIATSRVPLRVAGEREYPVRPLPETPSVELYRQRAAATGAAADIDLAQIAELCRRLDGLPLAIELAAGRAAFLAPDLLLERLDPRLPLLTGGRRDAPERHRTLEATIAWSYELLDERARQVFRSLSVFPASFSVEAAEDICGADLDVLEALVDANLVTRSGTRLSMLATIREFATARLGTGVGELRSRMVSWLAPRVEEARDSFAASDTEKLATFNAELDNIREAIAWAVDRDRAQALRLIYGAAELLVDAGYQEPVRRWLEQAYRADDPHDVRCKTLRNLVLTAADVEAARAYAKEWLEAGREVADPVGVAAALIAAGIVEIRAVEPTAARAFLYEALELSRSGHFDVTEAYVLLNLAEAYSISHDYAEAERHYDAAGKMLADAALWGSVTVCKRGIAWAHLMRSDAERGVPALREAIEFTSDTQSRGGMVICLDMAALLAAERDPELAARLLGAGDEVVASIGSFLREPDGPAERASAALDAKLGARGPEFRDEGHVLGLEGAVPLARAYVNSF
jgi:predicted ATPase/class 3 adenylate cyclase